jgi:hypothetical protein
MQHGTSDVYCFHPLYSSWEACAAAYFLNELRAGCMADQNQLLDDSSRALVCM